MGMTKAQCLAFEKEVEQLLTEVVGKPEPYLTTALSWSFDHDNGASVEMHLYRDSFDKGHTYRASWLACRLKKPKNWLDDGGYVKNRSDLPWPSDAFTYPSGKANFHPTQDTPAAWRRQLISHMFHISAGGSPVWNALMNAHFEPLGA